MSLFWFFFQTAASSPGSLPSHCVLGLCKPKMKVGRIAKSSQRQLENIKQPVLSLLLRFFIHINVVKPHIVFPCSSAPLFALDDDVDLKRRWKGKDGNLAGKINDPIGFLSLYWLVWRRKLFWPWDNRLKQGKLKLAFSPMCCFPIYLIIYRLKKMKLAKMSAPFYPTQAVRSFSAMFFGSFSSMPSKSFLDLKTKLKPEWVSPTIKNANFH